MNQNSKWTYRVLELKPGLTGLKTERVQDELNAAGLQGWELVSVTNSSSFGNTWGVVLYLKNAQ